MADKLIQAARYGNTYRVWELLYYGEDPDIINNKGETALIKASENGYTDTIKLLLNRNANPNIRNIYGATALMMASINDYTDIVQLLLDQEAKPDIRNNNGDTALTLASFFGHIDTVQLLLEATVNPNIRNDDGETALDLAESEGEYDIVRLLRSYITSYMAILRLQSLTRGRQTRHSIKTQRAEQLLATSRLPFIADDIIGMIAEEHSRMPHNREVSRRMKEEERIRPYTDWLEDFSQYGSGKRSRLNRRRKRTFRRF